MGTDKQAGMDIRTLQTALARIAEERAGDPLQAPKNIALSLAADAGILLSLFRGLTEQQNLQDDLAREAAADALTNILVDVARLANHIGMDASAALRARIKGRPAPTLAPLAPAQPAHPAAAAPEPGAKAAPAPEPAAAVAPPASAPTADVPTPSPAKTAPAPPAAETVVPPADAGPARKRSAPAVIAVKVAPEPPPRTPVAAAVEVVVLDDETPQAAAGPEAAPASQAVTPPDAHERIDPEQVLEMAKALARQLERSTRDDPVLRDLRDELETLRRSLYAASTKKAWIAGSLASIRGHLEEALTHAFAEEVRAAEFVARIDGLLAQ
jgi:hypothetical protein